MKVLIVGLGSIAKQHLNSLLEIDAKTEVFALRHQLKATEVVGVTNIYKYEEIPQGMDFAIIANPSSEHAHTLKELIHLSIPLFIEKPLFTEVANKTKLLHNLITYPCPTYVACNLRFHPVISYLKKVIDKKRPLELSVYCGSYLPDWRPGIDYRKNYSAIKSLGGGVHLDLIHEVDYTVYLLGLPRNSTNFIAKKSSLSIDTADIAHYVLDYEYTTAFITLNYYRKVPKRTIEIIWEDAIWYADLLTSSIKDEQGNLIFKEDFQMQDTYLSQLQYFINCLKAGKKPMNKAEEAFQTLKITLNE